MDPMTMMALGGALGGMMGGGGTNVSQSVSNSSYSAISANISGISNNPTNSGSQAASQTTPSGAVATSQPNTNNSSLLDSILASAATGGSDYSVLDDGTVSGITTPVTGVLSSNTMLVVVGGLAALAAAFWLFMKKGR